MSRSENGPAVRSTAPSNSRTRGAPPGPPPKATSAMPSPVTSPAATNTPPRNDSEYARNSPTWLSVTPSNTRSHGAAPGPRATIMSSTASPVRSAVATRAPWV